MALSNSKNFELNVTDYIEEAYERCGLELRTGYDLETAKRSMNLLLADWANRGLNQWTIQQTITTVTEGVNYISPGSDTIDVLDAVLRRNQNGTDTDMSLGMVSRAEFLNIPDKSFGTLAKAALVAAPTNVASALPPNPCIFAILIYFFIAFQL